MPLPAQYVAGEMDTESHQTEAEGPGVLERIAVRTTPGRLRAESIAVVVLALITGALAGFVVDDHLTTSREITNEAEPVIVSIRQVQTSLAEANAAAATAFLAGGVEDPIQRDIYLGAMDAAAVELENTARLIDDGDEETHEILQSMTAAMPRYAGLIESARANNRQGFPVGAAYLDAGATLLESEIYPGTDDVANRAAARYRDSYDRQRGQALLLGVIAVGLTLILLGALLFVQVGLRRRFNRTINPPIAFATIAALGLALWLGYGLFSQTNHLTSARNDWYQGTRLYLDIRGTGFGAKADEARYLIARGAGGTFEESFGARRANLDELGVALTEHAATSGDQSTTEAMARSTLDAWSTYDAAHQSVVEAEQAGLREEAVILAQTDAASAFTTFSSTTNDALVSNQERFVTEMNQAQDALQGLRVGSLVIVVLIAGLTAYGLQLRIAEYR